MDTSEAGKLGAAVTNAKLSASQRRANARKAAKTMWAGLSPLERQGRQALACAAARKAKAERRKSLQANG